jgi:hypothetical protein
MRKWLTAFFLLAVMTGGAVTGMPLHSGEKECPMAGMTDCCAKAQMKGDKPEVQAARVCCALNCNEPGTTTPTGSFKISPQLAVALSSLLVPRISPLPNPGPARSFSPPGYRQHSDPAYIRNLALLI